MKKTTFFLVALVLTQLGNVFAQQPTFLQYFFSIKKVLPETKKVGVFIPESEFSVQKNKIAQASQRAGIKTKVFLIQDLKSIGKNIQNLSDIDILLIYNTPILMKKTSRMFIISKCKDKHIPIITSSEEYSKFGALLGLIKGEDGHSKILLNLKLNPNLASVFTDDYVKKTGIFKRIQ